MSCFLALLIFKMLKAADGIPHSIAVGSMTAPDSETLCVAEIFMKSTKNNLAANENVAVLTVKGSESYLINATVIKRQVEGDYITILAINS